MLHATPFTFNVKEPLLVEKMMEKIMEKIVVKI